MTYNDRKTRRYPDGAVELKCSVNDAVMRLAEYEDSYLTPEEVKKIAEYITTPNTQIERYCTIYDRIKEGREKDDTYEILVNTIKEPKRWNEMNNDLISRQAAIKVLWKEPSYTDPLNVLTEARDRIESLPSAEPEWKWIPCSSGKMPRELRPVNITWINRNPEPYYADIKDKPFTSTGIYFRGQWYWYSSVCEDYLAEYGEYEPDIIDDAIEVVAWQLLPEPFGMNLPKT